MKYKYKLSLILFCLALLTMSGCASMSEIDCRNATRDTWVSVGLKDGQQGRHENTIRNHQRACEGITTPDVAAYQEGHAQGVDKYCVERTGYALGLRGRSVNRVCDMDRYPDYYFGHKVGINVYRSEENIKQLTMHLQQASQELADAEYEIKVVEAELVSPGLTTRQRKKLLREVKQLRKNLPEYSDPVDAMKHDLAMAVATHNRELKHNPFERRRPIKVPVITVQVLPDPQPHSQNGAPRKIIPESYIIARKTRRITYDDPSALLQSRKAHKVSLKDQKRVTRRDDNYLDKGYYHMFRFPNEGPMEIHWSGYSSGKGDVEFLYWSGRKFVPAKAEARKKNSSYVFDVKVPKREKYIYVMVNGMKDRIFTDSCYGKPKSK